MNDSTTPTCLRCDQTPAWQALTQQHAQQAQGFDLRQAFASDPHRFAHFSQQAPHVFADLSKNLIDYRTEALLLQLASQCDLAGQRAAMFEGQLINNTEERAVLHTLLRHPRDRAVPRQLAQQLTQVHATLEAMLAQAEAVRADARFTDVVTIGIGGSHLGPEMAVLALRDGACAGKRLHFVSNVDGHEIDRVLAQLDARRTLFIVASKTFTTPETMTNAHSARQWFVQQMGEVASEVVARHFWAVTTNTAAAQAFGIRTTFDFWDWVGGRFSLMSSIGAPLAIAIGAQGIRAMLAGAHAMDEHFQTAPLEQNLAVRLGLLDLWYRNFHGFGSRSVAPYHAGLARWPAYLQQLEMESNGKRVDRHGQTLPFQTAPVVWGECGTNGQHAYFQMLHQGTQVIPVEFVAARQASHAWAEHHPRLLANALAQAQALMLGREHADGHRHFDGNRPSTFLMLDKLDAASLGALIALHEHRVFVTGVLWGINSFDQWGVELGKSLATGLEVSLCGGDVSGLDASTAGLIALARGDKPMGAGGQDGERFAPAGACVGATAAASPPVTSVPEGRV